MISDKHFAGGANLYPDQGGGSADLAKILKTQMEDLVALQDLSGVAALVTADAVAVAAADAVLLPSLLTLANELKTKYAGVVALANAVKTALLPVYAYPIAAASAIASTVAAATDQPTADALLNDIKAKYNASVTLLNELKTDLNGGGKVSVTSASAAVTVEADSSDLTTGVALANDLKAKLNVAVTLINEIKADMNAVPKFALKSTALV